jgi:hypothetical protein
MQAMGKNDFITAFRITLWDSQTENEPRISFPVNFVVMGEDFRFPTSQAPAHYNYPWIYPTILLVHDVYKLIYCAALVLDFDGEEVLIERITPKIEVLGKIRLDSIELFRGRIDEFIHGGGAAIHELKILHLHRFLRSEGKVKIHGVGAGGKLEFSEV